MSMLVHSPETFPDPATIGSTVPFATLTERVIVSDPLSLNVPETVIGAAPFGAREMVVFVEGSSTMVPSMEIVCPPPRSIRVGVIDVLKEGLLIQAQDTDKCEQQTEQR